MRICYDEKIDALYFRLDDSKVVESEEMKPGIVLDFNAKKQVVGIEVLDLKRRVRHRNIKTERQYRRYLKEVQELVPLDPDPRSEQGGRLQRLARQVEDYEKERFKFRKPQSGV